MNDSTHLPTSIFLDLDVVLRVSTLFKIVYLPSHPMQIYITVYGHSQCFSKQEPLINWLIAFN